MNIFKKILAIICFIFALFFLICTCASFTSGISVLVVFLMLTIGFAFFGLKLWGNSKNKRAKSIPFDTPDTLSTLKSNNSHIAKSSNSEDDNSVGSLTDKAPGIFESATSNGDTFITEFDLDIPLCEECDVPAETNASSDNNSHIAETVAELKTERHKIAGTSFRQKDIESLGDENSFYTLTKKELIEFDMIDQNIYALEFSPECVELIEEPENEYDPNAVKVVVDDVNIGYIKKGSCAHIKKMIREKRIIEITAEIHGGKYKCISSDYDLVENKEIFKTENGKTDFYASIYITAKK